jgi:hypothetical protein
VFYDRGNGAKSPITSGARHVNDLDQWVSLWNCTIFTT